ncbi:polysaccharide biosynthesis/export family protein [Variovorax sp. J22R133]|uniref:polysaccharide biosynthesis/export family protein n=1 Tax=Variovorax brevis TaxID=3053503 RepID=UPI002576177E|nr:polysaccharide biosynthesis/export family protein [Variovorax sp. J22R133]MDM0114283.1 polysaccharide biosynthesis/export family protein [Variovorax sp. J22R133]
MRLEKSTAKPVVPAGSSVALADQPPDGAITPITPELIASLRTEAPASVGPEVEALLGEPPIYRIGIGDAIGIHVYDHPELVFSSTPATTVADPASVSPAPGFLVSSGGILTFPYAGQIRAAGMTIQELSDTLTQRLSRVFKNPQITVRVEAFRSKRAYVEGEVRTPGIQVFTDIPMTLPEAINRAGGINPAGDRSYVTLTRKGVTTSIDLMRMAEAGIDPARIPLQNGDLVFVRNRDERKVMVMGEVVNAQAMLMRNGRLSLNDALSEAGGVNLGTSNPRQIFVIRNQPQGGYTIYHLDARSATALAMADGFPLKPKDVVYVDPVPLVLWSRVANLVLPSSTAYTSVRNIPR